MYAPLPETPHHTPIAPAPKRRLKSLMKNKWFILVVLVVGFSLYWTHIRPVRLSRECLAQASVDARKLLQSKADVAKGTPQGAEYKKLIDKNLYLRSDYESFLIKCLTYNGLQITPIAKSSSSSSSSSSK